jgi:hypothetical protein
VFKLWYSSGLILYDMVCLLLRVYFGLKIERKCLITLVSTNEKGRLQFDRKFMTSTSNLFWISESGLLLTYSPADCSGLIHESVCLPTTSSMSKLDSSALVFLTCFVLVFQFVSNDQEESAASFCQRVAAWVPNIFATFIPWKITKLPKTQQPLNLEKK